MQTPLRYLYAVLLPHHTEPSLLFVQTEDGWALPHWQSTTLSYWQSCEHINEVLYRLLEINVCTLRCVERGRHMQVDGQIVRIYELENLDPEWKPPVGARWMNRREVQDAALAYPMQREIIDRWFQERISGVPKQRRQWAQRGWFAAASQWMIERVSTLSLDIVSPVQQVRTWERSCVLRIATNAGTIYCKAIPPFFAHELPLTHLLGTRYPRYTPRVMAYDTARGLLLTADFGGSTMDEPGPFTHWENAVSLLAQIQRELAPQADVLQSLGCPLRSLDELATDIQSLLADPAALNVGGKGLSWPQIDALRQQLPTFIRLCQELAAYQIPYTLEHGDFSPANVVWIEGHPLFFDWSDACITHPFFSLGTYADVMEQTFPEISDWREREKNAYIKGWQGEMLPANIENAYHIAQILAPFHHATYYHRFILPHMEAKWEMEMMIPYYLRMAL